MGWGRVQEGVVFPGPDSARERAFTEDEEIAMLTAAVRLGMSLADLKSVLGDSTFDIPLNDVAHWSTCRGKFRSSVRVAMT
jgi:hypothetical protein